MFRQQKRHFSMKVLYHNLGLKEGASKEEVKKSFFKIAQENHPDKNDTAKAKSIFMKAKDSYEKLKDVDPQKNSNQQQNYEFYQDYPQSNPSQTYSDYNRYANSQMNEDMFGYQNFQEFMSHFKNDSFFKSNQSFMNDFIKKNQQQHIQKDIRKRGKDIKKTIELTFQESVSPPKGTKGQKSFIKKEITILRGCLCTSCQGTGISSPQKDCPNCKGKGRTSQPITLEIRIPRGVFHRQLLEVQGEGDEGLLGYKDGTLLLEIQINKDNNNRIQRQGMDLTMSLQIGLAESLLGGTWQLETLDNCYVQVHLAPGQNQVRLQGQGVVGQKGQTGDLIVNVVTKQLVFDGQNGQRIKALLQQIRDIEQQDNQQSSQQEEDEDEQEQEEQEEEEEKEDELFYKKRKGQKMSAKEMKQYLQWIERNTSSQKKKESIPQKQKKKNKRQNKADHMDIFDPRFWN